MPRFVVTASAGTEALLSQEIQNLGSFKPRSSKGAVSFNGELIDALKVCLWSRVGMKVLMPLASFPATNADELYAGAKEIPWTDYLTVNHTFSIDASGLSDALRHTHFTALKVKDAICDLMRDKLGARPSVEANDPDVRIVVRLSRGKCEISLDVSGEPLFKRGYRTDPTRASLKETLAAAVVLATGYDGTKPFVDPMCGSGTLAIEACFIAQNRAPGINRVFGAERWPSFDDTLKTKLRALREQARTSVRRGAPPVFAKDRDSEAVDSATRNVMRAGVPVKVEKADARELVALVPPGFVVCNPPYGERLDAGGKKTLKTFFWQLGQKYRELHGHTVAMLISMPELESAFGMPPVSRTSLMNGPIPVELLKWDIR